MITLSSGYIDVYPALNSFFNNEYSNRDSYFPKINVYYEEAESSDSKDKVIIEAALCGYNKDEVSITIDESESSLLFEYKRRDEEKDNRHIIRQEMKKSSFKRKLLLHKTLNLKSAKPYYEDGIVTIIFEVKSDEELGKRKIVLSDKEKLTQNNS
jgi:HSP20 family molecular chaperone IbpA